MIEKKNGLKRMGRQKNVGNEETRDFCFLIVKGKFLRSSLFRFNSTHIQDVWMCHLVDPC